MNASTESQPATEAQILAFRQRVLAGETLEEAEVRSALMAFRQKRMTAAEQSATKKSKAGPTRSAEELKSLFGAPVTKTDAQ